MRRELLDRTRCPQCRGRLSVDGDADVIDGEIVCTSCSERFRVLAGIPALVPPGSPLRAGIDREAAARPARASLGTDAERQRDYWENDEAHRDVEHPVVAGFSRQRWEHLSSLLPFSTMQTALDVGAGNGFSTAYAPPHLDIVATDGSRRMLSRHPGRDRLLADAMALPFPDRAFDVVYCWELLHHVDEPHRALREMARVSKRYVFFFEPNPWNAAQAAFAIADPEHRWVLRFRRGYTVDQAEKAGLRVVHYQRCGLIFPNKTPQPLFEALIRLPFRIPWIGISQLVIAERTDA